MRVHEIFYSIQGEGILAGMPSVFVRTVGCNLRCRWCDTREAAWKAQGRELGVEQIVAAIQPYPSRFCVLTGGEPMLAEDLISQVPLPVVSGRVASPLQQLGEAGHVQGKYGVVRRATSGMRIQSCEDGGP